MNLKFKKSWLPVEKKICIIGFGEMGKRHARDMHEHSGGKVKIAAVCELDDKKYAQGTKWLGYAPERFSDSRQMIKKVRPDGCIISSPNHTHWKELKQFKGKKIPLIIEKPLDSTFEKLLKVVDFADKYDAPIMVHHVMRYAPIIRKARELIEQGAIGKLCSFRFCLNGTGAHMHNFRRNKVSGGGQMLEKATHDLDIMLHLMNSSPRRVAAICKQQIFGGDKNNEQCCSSCEDKRTCDMCTKQGKAENPALKDIHASKDLCVYAADANIPDNELCMIELENGCFGSQTNNFFTGHYYSRVYEVTGSNGLIRICLSLLPYQQHHGYDGTLELFPRFGDGYQRFEFNYHDRIHYDGSPGVFEHFYDLMCGRTKEVYSPVNEAFAAEMIAIAAYESNKSGSYITIRDLLPDKLKESFSRIFDLKKHGGKKHESSEKREGQYFYTDRIAGCDRDHSDTGRDAAAGAGKCPGHGKTHQLHQQFETDISRTHDVCRGQ